MVVVPYIELTPRGKADYHEDVVVTEGGSAFDFTGYVNFICELKAKDDHSGTAVMTATVAIAGAPDLGTLDLDITEAITTLAQDADPQVLEGVVDLVADNASGVTKPFFQGTWRLDLGVSD